MTARKNAVTEYKNFEGHYVKSDVENCHCYILTSMEIDEITPLHFGVRYFINILAKNINLVIRSLKVSSFG